MANVVYIAGVPASGKSTIVARLKERLFPTPSEFSHGKCKGIEQGNLRLLGVYDGSTFGGTDKLSMTVIEDAIAYCNNQSEDCIIIAEGDRLFNKRFLTETKARLLLIDAHPAILRFRHQKRGDMQSEEFLKGRRTKVENFIRQFNVQRVFNNTEADADMIVAMLTRMIKQYGNVDKSIQRCSSKGYML